ncbi:unannotated protein [freshwater metagenome]|uniref:Unannotated protein n=1 Tax=freshwater metagenome TaxID=449393 RepID=A0A6J7EHP6_9ZZZZ|nr:DUF1365 family protein [Actinomycetota bacterium]
MTGAALYTGLLEHRRLTPAEHGFSLPVQMALVDLSALPGVFDHLPFWSARRPAAVWLRRADYGDGGSGPLDTFVRDLVLQRIGMRPTGPVRMLTNLRTLGYVFNPLTVYFCGERGASDQAVVLEVSNTPWGERHWYVVPDPQAGAARFPKELHVSPFLTMEGDYRFTLEGPDDILRLGLELERAGDPVFQARLVLRRRTLTPRTAVRSLLERPFMTYRVTAEIHLQALKLWRKGVPFVPHPGRGETA